MKGNSLTLDQLVVARDGAPLTPPIDLTLAAGDLLIVLGNNGSGKSSLLKTIAGLLRPASGRYTATGAKNDDAPTLYMGHKRGLTPSMSVYDNVSFWARATGYPELTAAAMHYFDLGDVADVPLSTLSAGWQQRVALTRLITIPAWLWLLDEPTANLDREGMALLHSLMEVRLQQGGIILMTTHAQLQGDNIKTLNLNEIAKEVQLEDAC